jgi:hypothetical protein
VSRARHSKARHRSLAPSTSSLSLGSLAVNSRFVRLSAAGVVVASLGVGAAALTHGGGKPMAEPQPTATETPNLQMRQNAGTSRNLATRPPARPTTKPSTLVRKPKATPKTTAAAPKPTPSKTTSAKPIAVGTRYTTASLNVRTGAGKHFPVLDQLSTGDKVSITGKTSGTWSQVLLDGVPAWVATTYLSKEKPTAATSGGISSAPCADGSGVEDGLRADTIRVHRAVCALFPGVKSYGGTRGGGGNHSVGRALDIMVGFDSSLGDQIADYVRAHAKELGVSEVIWKQRIWTVQRSSEGWRPMEDRGSGTANHMDHVHVSTYGDSGTA